MDINEFCVGCINLDSRPDRWEESQKEFESIGLNVSRIVATEAKNPIVGCAESHFGFLQLCLALDLHAMVFEDDVHFINNANPFEYLYGLDYIHWNMLYFGANITTPIYKITSGFGRLTGAQSTHAYCVNKFFIPEILKYKNLLGKHMDLIYSEDIIPNNNCYITIPMLAIQRPSYSDIEKKFVDYSWMEDRYKKNLVERN